MHELIGIWSPTQNYGLALDLLYGMSQNETINGAAVDASWVAGELAFKYTVNSVYTISPRVEIYRDNGGLTSGLTQTLDSLTLTNSFTLAPGFEIRAEVRRDHSSDKPFIGTDGMPSCTQVTGTAGFLFSF